MKTINIGLVGVGTVGGGVVRMLNAHAQEYARHQEVDICLKKASSRTKQRAMDAGVAPEVFVDDWHEVIADPDIDMVVELIGGTGVAFDVIIEALNAGKNVVTANKAVMASRGKELFEAAAEHGVELAFEASVGGGIPIIDPMKHALTGNKISSVLGIVNGTTNYMLTRMSEEGLDYAAVLKEAQDLGFAEADPSADVDGYDAAAKIAILASIAFNSRVTVDQVSTEGISKIEPVDFVYADEMGYVIKLLSIAHNIDGEIDVRVHPAMISKSHPLANVNGVYNAIFVHGDFVGNVMFMGEGAGSGAAASAVMGDIIEVARHVSKNVPPIVGDTCTDTLKIRNIDELCTKYYLRMAVKDEAGVLAAATKVFAAWDVSICTMVQRSAKNDKAELTFTTHTTNEQHMQKALQEIKDLEQVEEISQLIRIEEAQVAHLSEQDVIKIADYARIGLTDEELKTMTQDLNNIIDELKPITEYDLEGVEPTFHPIGSLCNVMREDEIGQSFSQECALSNAATTQDGCFEIPAILAAKEGEC